MGTPKQEVWAHRTVDRLNCDVLWSVGALFDFVSGRVPRAPASLSDNGLEWIFRLAIEPKRMWRRYLVGNPVFLHRVMAQARQRHDEPALTRRAHLTLVWLALFGAASLALGLATYAGVQGRGGVADAGARGDRLRRAVRDRRLRPDPPVPAGRAAPPRAAVGPAGRRGRRGARAGAARLRVRAVRLRAGRSCSPAGSRAAIYAWRRDPGLPLARSARQAGVSVSWGTLLVPLYLAVLIGAIALVPMFRGGFVTVIGNGSDAHLAVGTAEFLQDHHPNAAAPEEPVDRVPLVWRSKPPIYLAFGAVARVAGMEPYAVIATLAAALMALGALGFWLLARELLGAGAWAAGAAMGLVGLNRMTLFTGMHPYFNQTWGYMALPFAIVLAWYVVRRRSRGGLLLFASFLGVLVFAYPLAMPIPLIAAIIFWAFERRRQGRSLLRLPRLHNKRNLLWIVPLFLLLLLPLQGVLEKVAVSTRVLAPGYSLVNWGGDLTGFFPERYFLGFDEAGLGLAGMILLDRRARARAARRAARHPLGPGRDRRVRRPRRLLLPPARIRLVLPLQGARLRGAARRGGRRHRAGAHKWRWVGAVTLIFLIAATRLGAAKEIGAHVRPAAQEPARAQARRRAAAARRVGAPRHAGRRAPAVGRDHPRPASRCARSGRCSRRAIRTCRSRARPTTCSSTTTGASRSTRSARRC